MSYLQLGSTECWPFKGPRDDAPNINSVMACRNPQCCNPRHFVKEQTAGQNPIVDDSMPTDGIPNQEEGPERETPTKRRGRPPKVK